MNKTELIAAAAEKAGVSKKEAEAVVTAAFDAIAASLKEGERSSSSALALLRSGPAPSASAATPGPMNPSRFPPPRFLFARPARP